jgi:hypothetical protein
VRIAAAAAEVRTDHRPTTSPKCCRYTTHLVFSLSSLSAVLSQRTALYHNSLWNACDRKAASNAVSKSSDWSGHSEGNHQEKWALHANFHVLDEVVIPNEDKAKQAVDGSCRPWPFCSSFPNTASLYQRLL